MATLQQVRERIRGLIRERGFLAEDPELRGKIRSGENILGLEYVLLTDEGEQTRPKVRIWILHAKGPYFDESEVTGMAVAIGKVQAPATTDAVYRQSFGVTKVELFHELKGAGFDPVDKEKKVQIRCANTGKAVEFGEFLLDRHA